MDEAREPRVTRNPAKRDQDQLRVMYNVRPFLNVEVRIDQGQAQTDLRFEEMCTLDEESAARIEGTVLLSQHLPESHRW